MRLWRTYPTAKYNRLGFVSSVPCVWTEGGISRRKWLIGISWKWGTPGNGTHRWALTITIYLLCLWAEVMVFFGRRRYIFEISRVRSFSEIMGRTITREVEDDDEEDRERQDRYDNAKLARLILEIDKSRHLSEEEK